MDRQRWTGQDVYCFPAVVSYAVEHLSRTTVAIEDLSRDLGIRVRSTDTNPWGLEVATDPSFAGLTRNDALDRIPGWLSRNRIPVAMEYQPGNSVTDRDLQGFWEQEKQQNCVVAASLNWCRLIDVDDVSLHVVEVIEYTSQTVVVEDHSQLGFRAKFDVQRFEGAMLEVDGGFWTFTELSI